MVGVETDYLRMEVHEDDDRLVNESLDRALLEERTEKDRNKGRKRRREEKDHASKERDRSREREAADRVDSRERRKEDRDHEKDMVCKKERSRDKVREKDYDKDAQRVKEHDREKDVDRDRQRSYDRERERGRDRGKDRARDYEGRDRDLTRDYGKGERAYYNGGDWEKNSERDRDGVRGRVKVKCHERDHGKENERDLDRERGKKRDRDRTKDREREREKDRHRAKEKGKDREKVKDREKDRERDKLERVREKEVGKDIDQDESRTKDGEREASKVKEEEKNGKVKVHVGDNKNVSEKEDGTHDVDGVHETIVSRDPGKNSTDLPDSTSDLGERIMRMKEERLERKPDGASEISSWVSKTRKLEEKRNAAMEKAAHLAKLLDEQDAILEESEDEDTAGHTGKDLAGIKILHGLNKVMEGGAIVLTLKDKNILVDGDLNEDIDMLENVEIGEQKQRDEAYKAAKKKTGIYDDRFNDDTGTQRTILPQYDDPVDDEGVTLDESGRFTGEAEKKLEELRKRIEGGFKSKSFEDLSSSGKNSSDYYTPDEMLQFKKPKKKKSLRKKEKLDLDALEAEAISLGLGAGDLGSRKDSKRQAAKEEQERLDAVMRSNAYQSAYARAEEASKALRQEQTLTVRTVEDDDLVFGEDYEDLQKSLEQARKLALKRQDEAAGSGPQAISDLAISNKEKIGEQSPTAEEPQENKVVITEMEEFVLGLQFNEDLYKPETDDVFMDENDAMESSEREANNDSGGWNEVEEIATDELSIREEEKEVTTDEIIHETPIGKGLSGALKLLNERGTLKEDINYGGRNTDRKKSKLEGTEIDWACLNKTDEFGRIVTPKEAFRMLSHKFHGKAPGKSKQEKRMKDYLMELQTKQMKASDTPSQAMERMREAQARLKTPYLVLSGHVKPGQTSDPRSGFATVEKDHLGSLTPMLGDKKVEHFLGISRKSDPGSMGPPPPKKHKN